jgi:proteasome lid subunit RPN8/RPN11
MRKDIRAAIERHALADYPREACGLLLAVRGREHYRPCRNLAEGTGQFRLAADDWAAAEDAGEILAVVHSHPDAPVTPSQADRVACEATGVPWYIVGVRADTATGSAPRIDGLHRFTPTGWRAPLVGRAFFHGVLDCYALVRDYFARERGITLPDFERRDDWWLQGDDLYMRHFAEAGFAPLPQGAPLRPSDVILMQVRPSPQANHAAVFLGDSILAEAPDLHPLAGAMLHHLYGRLSERAVYGGHWLECTRLVIRHRELA